jgi:hypothetical protein
VTAARESDRAHAAPDAPKMRPLSKTFRARQVHRDMTYDGLAHCGDRGEWWSQREAAHERASTAKAAAAAAAPAMRMCAACPETGAQGRCALRAQLDAYTGLAAGQAWVAGRSHPVGKARVRRTSGLSPSNPERKAASQAPYQRGRRKHSTKSESS